MASMKYLLIVAIMATLASSALAVRCYQCEKCSETFDAQENVEFECNTLDAPSYLLSVLTGRNANPTGCMKQVVENTILNVTNIVRSCYYGDISNIGCMVNPVNYPASKLKSCYVCTSDLCNGSKSMAPVVLAIVTFFGVARVFA